MLFDLNDIKVKYVATSASGKKKEFEIIFYDTLRDSLPEILPEDFPDFTEYLETVVPNLKGCVTSEYDISWYARTKGTSDLVEAVNIAAKEGNRVIIIEYLD